MSTAYAGEPGSEPAEISYFPENDGDDLSLAAWLDVVAGDEPVDLPRPAADYLADARAAGEV
jgi:hypothetical protein